MLSAAAIEVGGQAVDEVRTALRIANGDEDALAAGLVGSAASLCEQFTGRVLLRRGFAETMPAPLTWTRLRACPVHVISGLDAIGEDASAVALAPGAYLLDVDAGGEGWVRLTGSVAARRVRVRYEAGIAADWAELPEALRHGVVRLAAHLYGARDRADESAPPAAVTALWRPWRRLRL